MPQSKAQVRAAHAVLSGTSDIFGKDFAQDVVNGMAGRKMSALPERTGPKKTKRPMRIPKPMRNSDSDYA